MTSFERAAWHEYLGCKIALSTMSFLLALRLKEKSITVDAATRLLDREEIPERLRGDCNEYAAIVAEMPVPWSEWVDKALELRYNAVAIERDRLYVDAVKGEYERIKIRDAEVNDWALW